jgi:hypothetical protein
VKLRIWKSLTFFVGLILFIAAFGVLLVAGSIFNPPPYRIVIAVKDIAPYTTLSQDMVVVDEQTMNQTVASRLVHEGEVEHYLGGMVIETIHAGEPLRRNAVTTSGNPAAAHRLSLALTDPDLVAAVVPVTPKIIPDNVTAGDYINVTMGIAGNVSQLATTAWGEAGGAAWGLPGGPTPTPPPFTSTFPLTSTSSMGLGQTDLLLGEEMPEVAPPLDKLVLPQVEVIHVARERMPNPNYGMGFGEEGSQEPVFLEGDIESLTLLVPKAAEELLYFAVDNGTLHLSIVPHIAVLEGTSPSTGILWEDIVRFFQEERLRALGVLTDSVTATSTLSPTAPITVGTAITNPVAPPPAPAPTETSATTSPTPAPPGVGSLENSDGGMPGGEDLVSSLSSYIAPVCIGGALVLGLGAIGFMLARRRKG